MTTSPPPPLPRKVLGRTLDGAGRRVLIVDDDPDIRDWIAWALRPYGFEVVSAGDGADGLRLLRRHPADLLILDLLLPGMEGMQVLKRVRDGWPATRIVVVSAYGDWHRYFEMLKQGAVDVLTKPLDIEELLRVISGAMDSTV